MRKKMKAGTENEKNKHKDSQTVKECTSYEIKYLLF